MFEGRDCVGDIDTDGAALVTGVLVGNPVGYLVGIETAGIKVYTKR